MHTSFSFGAFISGESETKPIKPINHEQPTNWRLSISTALLITSLADYKKEKKARPGSEERL
jgi:hypothetical protein